MAQADFTKHLDQINMLVQTRPIHPGLPESFTYQPFLVTTGEFTPVAVSLVNELNASWQQQNLRPLKLIGGRRLHVDFVSLSSDFWPVEAPAVRRFRELYLVDGRGDLDLPLYACFLMEILRGVKSGLDLGRRVAATNLFASYLLSEFQKQKDHWSVFQGWAICAAQIAWAGEQGDFDAKHWRSAFDLAKEGALISLKDLSSEVLQEGAFRVCERELHDLTRTRNTVALATAACWQLLAAKNSAEDNSIRQTVELVSTFIEQGNVFFWGEGALFPFLMIVWLLERGNHQAKANGLLMSLIELIAKTNAQQSEEPFEDPYSSPDECLAKMFEAGQTRTVGGCRAVVSYSLFPLILLAARRGMRAELERAWPQISHVHLTWFEAAKPADALLWHCEEGKECTDKFAQPQSWKELYEIAFRDRQDHLPQVLREDRAFGLLFALAFPHRIMPSLVKHLDTSLVTT
jgi:hypothetical protein